MPASTYLWVWKSLFTGVPLLFRTLGNSSSTVRMIDVKIPFLVQYYYSIHMRSLWSYNSYYWSQIESISKKVATKWYQVFHTIVTGSWLNRREKCGTYAIPLLYAKWWRLSTRPARWEVEPPLWIASVRSLERPPRFLACQQPCKWPHRPYWQIPERLRGLLTAIQLPGLALSILGAGCWMCVRPNTPPRRAHSLTRSSKMHF